MIQPGRKVRDIEDFSHVFGILPHSFLHVFYSFPDNLPIKIGKTLRQGFFSFENNLNVVLITIYSDTLFD